MPKIIIPKEELRHEELHHKETLEARRNSYMFPKEEPNHDKQDSPEEETLNKIKFVLSCGNEAQAIRLIEQYGEYRQEQVIKAMQSVAKHINSK